MNKNLKIELKDTTITAVNSTAFIHAMEPNFLYFLDKNICVHMRSFKTNKILEPVSFCGFI